MKNIKTWQERCLERGIGSCEARDEELIELRAELDHVKQVEFPKKCGAVAAGWRGKVERLEAELDKLKQQEPTYLLTPAGYVVGAQLDAGHAPGTLIKLYLAAGASKPLTREQVKSIMNSAGYEKPQERADFINGIRHCELAHGIT